MAWWTGKPHLTCIALGDSNMVGMGGSQIDVQTYNTALRCYATTATIPYNTSELLWRTLDPDAASRADQSVEAMFTQNVPYTGQVLGGNGNAAMQMANVLQVGTGATNVWVYQTARGGTDALYWASGGGWSTLTAQLPTALAGITGSPTAADVIYISLGGNDFLGVFNSPAVRYTAEQFYTNFNTLRSNMIAQGWWVPGTTQIILGDIFRSSTLYELWFGLETVLAKFPDRIALVSSVGATYLDEAFDVHFTPQSLTDMGTVAGNLVLNQIPLNVPPTVRAKREVPIGSQNLFSKVIG